MVASDTNSPQFESRHRQIFIEHLFTVKCIEKTKIKEKEAGTGPFFKSTESVKKMHSSQLRYFAVEQSGQKTPTVGGSITLGMISNLT